MVVQEEGGPSFPDANLGDISADTVSVYLPAARFEKGAANHIAQCSPWPVDQEDAVVERPGHAGDDIVVEAIDGRQQSKLRHATEIPSQFMFAS